METMLTSITCIIIFVWMKAPLTSVIVSERLLAILSM